MVHIHLIHIPLYPLLPYIEVILQRIISILSVLVTTVHDITHRISLIHVGHIALQQYTGMYHNLYVYELANIRVRPHRKELRYN